MDHKQKECEHITTIEDFLISKLGEDFHQSYYNAPSEPFKNMEV